MQIGLELIDLWGVDIPEYLYLMTNRRGFVSGFTSAADAVSYITSVRLVVLIMPGSTSEVILGQRAAACGWSLWHAH